MAMACGFCECLSLQDVHLIRILSSYFPTLLYSSVPCHHERIHQPIWALHYRRMAKIWRRLFTIGICGFLKWAKPIGFIGRGQSFMVNNHDVVGVKRLEDLKYEVIDL
ncbi:hypothetical protein RJT34_03749 [Clitoria ternatea]|uniref:Uncharacterized protein n=1 Tax=Clitoria ternatea TaxID=43366 RepID=A0AAN9Q017_CLITE